MSQEWFFTVKGQQVGPIDWTYLQQLAAAGQIAPTEMVWCEGRPEWMPAGTVPGLFSVPSGAATTVMPSANGAGFPAPAPASIPTQYTPQYSMADPYFTGHSATAVYAGFWLRFFAYLVDSVLLGLIMVPFLMAYVAIDGVPHVADPNDPVGSAAAASNPAGLWAMRLLGVFIAWVYYALQESGTKQATFGKRLLGLVVTDDNGNRLSFMNATGRYFGKLISSLVLCIGYIMAGTTERKQALHDMLASCLVVIKPE